MNVNDFFQRAAAGVAALGLSLAIFGSYFAVPATQTATMVLA